jgi:hypothetical protein
MNWLTGLVDFLIGSAKVPERAAIRPRSRPAVPPASGGAAAGGKAFQGRVHCLINPEGEMQQVDTGDPAGLFYGPVWDRFLEEVSNRGLLLARVAEPAYRYERDRFNRRVAGGTRTAAGYLLEFADFDLGRDGRGRVWRAFLPGRQASHLRPEQQVGRYACVSVRQFDRNTLRILVSEVAQARPLHDLAEARQFLEALGRLAQSAHTGDPVRGEVYEVTRKVDRVTGLLVNVADHAVFLPAGHSLGLADLPEEEVLGLPVTGLLQVDAAAERLRLSLRHLYYGQVAGQPYPRPGSVVEAIAWAVTGDEWQWLLPRRRLGFVRLRAAGLDRDGARSQCGWIGSVRVLREEKDGEMVRYEVEPVWAR